MKGSLLDRWSQDLFFMLLYASGPQPLFSLYPSLKDLLFRLTLDKESQ